MDKSTITIPILNYIQGNEQYLEEFYLKYSSIHFLARNSGLSLIQFHKKMLGKQNYCFTNSQKLWVWEKTIVNVGWRIYVGNKKGVCFEVHEKCSPTESMKMFNDYYLQIA